MDGSTAPPVEADGHVNGHGSSAKGARELMRLAGVRYTLSRSKLIEALFAACVDNGYHLRGVAPQSLHQVLHDTGEPLSSASVRQVLRRMSAKGLIESCGHGRYRFSPQDMSLMAGTSELPR